MKDIYGNEYVRPAACSHSTCPPWQCVEVNPAPPEPPMSPAQEEQAERERRESYREHAARLRGAADSAPSPRSRDRVNRIADDLELMAQGRVTETTGWKEDSRREWALENWRAEVRQANSTRLRVGVLVGIILAISFVIPTFENADYRRAEWFIPHGFIVLIITAFTAYLFKGLLNFLFGLPERPKS